MFKQKIESIMSDLSNVLPDDMKHIKEEIEKNLRATLNANFAKLELVTREEFDIQAALLQRTRAKLDALEKKIAAIENK
ncbi:accessory factor UbiK family protein [Gammaproteobacteria bacterium]|jgi:BMFP domain-containing protein YqiC|nr:accessory factor UbiK family protein [Gammaproteobacteria bacterium]|tara:strand:+ start:662 stop:898 length:237 start_codon:yes stop_codon:yes gene_type:complete